MKHLYHANSNIKLPASKAPKLQLDAESDIESSRGDFLKVLIKEDERKIVNPSSPFRRR